MRNKLTLLLAAAMMAFTFQTAMAEDIDLDDEIDDVEYSINEPGMTGPRGRRFGPRDDDHSPGNHMRHGRHEGRGEWIGGPGHGPGMRPGMHPDMRMGRDMGHGMMGPRMMEALDLTDAQKNQAVDVLTDNFRQRLLARMELADAHKKLRDLYDGESPDHDAIIAANTAVGTAKGKMDVLNRKLRDNMRGILTPDQIQKMDDMKKDRPRGWDKPGDGKRPMRGKPGPEGKR